MTGLDLHSYASEKKRIVWQLVERTSIKPGVYRLNKPWENEEATGLQPTGSGLLAKLGLPLVVELVDINPVGTIGKSQ